MNTEWIALKACIIILQNNRCAMCKKELKDQEFTLHHIIPRDLGGKDALYNLIGLCNKCHDIAEDEQLNRFEINNYYKSFIPNKCIRKIYNDKTKKKEYEYPEVIILHKKYIIKPKRIMVYFQADQEFKDELIKAGKSFKADGISCPLSISGFCRIAVEKLIAEERSK